MSWTRLEDGLPKTTDGDVLWYDEKDGTVDLEHYSTMPPKFYTDSYTHWMPVPELPKT